MVGRDLAEEVGVIDQGAKEIYGVDHRLAARDAHHRRVVRRVQPDEHVVALDRFQSAERTREYRGTDFRAAAAAAHGDRG